ncbi:serine protease [Hamadaea sp. NPDC050747]|uniref:trypsin-like serine peptidase n=1 Tax=Hamadaea sp. NPDC050747 TaxID=3155789 RepID=UPI0033D07128
MRRTLALALGLAAVLAAGTATAAHVLRPDDQPQQQIWSVGAEETGKVEAARTILGYVGTRKDATFRYPGADYVKVHFTRLALLPGDYLTVSRPDGGEVQRYDGRLLEGVTDTVSSLVDGSGGKWAMSITGDTAVVRLHLADDVLGLRGDLARLGVTVDKVARGMTATERAAKKKADDDRKRELARNGREESVCGGDDKADAVCYKTTDPVMYQRSKAVARLLIKGTELCTAWRVGPDNRMITNHHCFTTDAEAADTEVWFNYACARCGGYEVFKPTKVWAAHVLATDKRLDYTLFTVDDFAAVQQYGYLQFDVRAPAKGEQVYIPQNPAGEPTAIAASSDSDRPGNCQIVDPAYDGYDTDTDASYYCDTEGGSSGSPVISRATNKVIALHHFGGCPNSGVRIDEIYQAIGRLL